MSQHKSHINFIITLLAIGWGLLVAVTALRAQWSGPNAQPPGGNPSSFLTSGTSSETKTGPLTIDNNFYVTGNTSLGSTATPTSARVVITPYSNSSIDAGNGSIRTTYIPASDYDVVTKTYLASSLSGSSYWLLSTSTNSLYPTSTDWKVAIGTTTAGTAKLAVMGGNVGIGTTNPGQKLEIVGTAGANATPLLISTTGTWSSGQGSGIQFKDSSGEVGHIQVSYDGTRTNLNIGGFYNGGYGSASNQIFTIQGNGNVGIGTATPIYHLDIRGASGIGGNILYAEGNGKTDGSGTLLAFTGYSFNGNLVIKSGSNLDASAGINLVNDYTTDRRYSLFIDAADSKKLKINTDTSYSITSFASNNLLVIDSSGSVGIGTTSPAAKLDVNGGGSFTQGVSVPTPTAGGYAANKDYVDSVASAAGSALWTLNGSKLYASSTSWDVGIGTTSPNAKLDVNGSLAVRGSVSFTGPLYIGSNRLLMVDSSGNVTATSTQAGISMPSGTTGQTLRYGSGGWEATSTIHVANSGNVGIGTTNPYNPLEIFTAGSSNLNAISVHRNSLDGEYIGYGFSINTGNNGFKQSIAAIRTKSWGVGDLAFILNNNETSGNATLADEKMRITSGGNVGIGTTSPNAKLDVNGSLAVRGSVSFTGPLYIGSNRLLMVDSSGNVTATSTQAGVSMPSGSAGQTLRYGTSGWEATSTIYVKDGGNVGIGTTTPVAKLHISSKANSYYHAIQIENKQGDYPGFKYTATGGTGDYGNHNVLFEDARPSTTGSVGSFFTIYRSGALTKGNILQVGINTSANNLVVSGAGNVGIGTTSPAAKLDVNGGGSFTQFVFVPTPTDAGHAANKSYVDSVASAAGSALWVNSGSNLYASSTSWNVGIGTTSPATKLHIYDASSGPIITLSGLDTKYRGLTIKDTSSNEKWFVGNNTSNNFVIRATNTNDILTISSSNGNVGIGTTNPQKKLEVAGDLGINPTNSYGFSLKTSVYPFKGYWHYSDDGTGYGPAFIHTNNTSGTTTPTIFLQTSGDNATLNVSDRIGIGTMILTSLGTMPTIATRVFINGAENANSYFNSGGNVGIGTTSPSASLAVNGNAIANTPTAANHLATKAYVDSASQSLWVNSGSNLYASSTSWNVGIGTNNPNNKLEIKYLSTSTDQTQTSAYGLRISNSGWNSNQVSGIEFWNGSNNKTVPTSRIVSQMNGGGGGGENLYFQTQPSSASNPNPNQPTTKLTILADGNVGIGTTSPAASLAVNGNAIASTPTAGGHLATKAYVDSMASAASSALWVNSSSNLYASSTSWNVGIGTTNPGTAKLAVMGGNMGIGTTNPKGLLQIDSSTSDPLKLRVHTELGSANSLAGIAFGVDTGNQYMKSAIALQRKNSNGQGDLVFMVDSNSDGSNVDINDEKLRIQGSSGNVGIGTTSPSHKLDVNGGGSFTQFVFVPTPTDAGHAVNKGYVDSAFSSTTANYVLKTGDTMTGTLEFATGLDPAINVNWNNIVAVNKLGVVVIDPLYDIGGTKYSSYAPSVVGGVKEEHIGKGTIKDCNHNVCSWVLDFSKVAKGSDLWVWRQIVDFRPETTDVLMTAYGRPASLSYEIGDNQIIFYADHPTQFSYRLVGSRFDWRQWPTLALDQSEPTSLIVP